MTGPEPVLESLLRSGFPFQTAVAQMIRGAAGWSLIEEEFPWRDDEGRDCFVDLVARCDILKTLVVECKKTDKDALTFLLPTASGDVHEVRAAWCVHLSQVMDSTRRVELFSGMCEFDPRSWDSMFCVVSTSRQGKDTRLLERDAQALVRGTDSYALHDKRHISSPADGEPDRIYVPALVTNAPLYVAKYDPASVDLKSGELPRHTADVSPADWVRFSKSFTLTRGCHLGARTVFVVHAEALGRFLEQFKQSDFDCLRNRRALVSCAS